MAVVVDEIFELHSQIKHILQEFQWHTDFTDRMSLLKSSKKTIAKYLRASSEMNKVLRTSPNTSHNLETFFTRYAQTMNRDAQKIINIYLKYGYGCDEKNRQKFQTEFTELQTVLRHRIDVEEYYLLPEYKLMKKRQMTYNKATDSERSHPDLEITQPL